MKNLLYCFFACLLVPAIFAKDLSEAEAAALVADIESIMAKFEAGEVQPILDSTHESLIKMMGGQEPFESVTKAAVAQIEQMGIKYLESQMGTPTQVYVADSEEVCFVPRSSVMSVNGQKVKSTGFMIAVRKIGAAGWKYLDGAALQQNPELLWMLLPALSRDIQLPTNKTELIQ